MIGIGKVKVFVIYILCVKWAYFIIKFDLDRKMSPKSEIKRFDIINDELKFHVAL